MIRTDKAPGLIFKLRILLGLDQPEFGRLLNVTSSTVCNWERGKRSPRIGKIHKMLKLAKSNNIPLTANDFLYLE